MTQLEKLRVDLLSLTQEELLERIREIRGDRRITKGAPKSVAKKSKQRNTIVDMFEGLSPEDKAALLASLEE